MIFNWEEEFSEKLVLDGIDMEDDVSSIDRTIDHLSGCVSDGKNDYWVHIDLTDDFRIESMECDCNKGKCSHMTALLHANNFKFRKYIEYNLLIDNLDKDKLIKFLKDLVMYDDDCQDEFNDKFLCDILKDKKVPMDEKVFFIFEYYDWPSIITDFVKNDVTELYNNGNYDETFYLVSIMFKDVIDRHTYDNCTDLKECYNAFVELIRKLSKTRPDLIKKFMEDCKNHNYLNLYPPFWKIYMEFH